MEASIPPSPSTRQKNQKIKKIQRNLIEIKHEIQLVYVAEEAVEYLDEEVNNLEVRELVVVGVDVYAEEEARVASIDDLKRAELESSTKLD